MFQIATALILFLAANTSFNAFPRLAAILAEDGYFPRQFSFRGDRLAYSWGIILLAAIAAGIYIAFQGNTTSLIPLYSVGVFVCFTLSQTGMVRHWVRTRAAGWWWRMAVNAFGALLTLVVLAIVVTEKFSGGAFVVVILIPLLVGMMLFIHRQYAQSARQLAIPASYVAQPPIREERAIVPIPELNRAAVQAVNVARSISEQVTAVFISDDQEVGGLAPRALAAPGAGRAAGHRRVPVPRPGGAADGLSRRPRPRLAARQARPDHVRRPARVRGAQLVGADPLQPVGAPPAERPAGPAAHGDRGRALSPRRARQVPGARRAARDAAAAHDAVDAPADDLIDTDEAPDAGDDAAAEGRAQPG